MDLAIALGKAASAGGPVAVIVILAILLGLAVKSYLASNNRLIETHEKLLPKVTEGLQASATAIDNFAQIASDRHAMQRDMTDSISANTASLEVMKTLFDRDKDNRLETVREIKEAVREVRQLAEEIKSIVRERRNNGYARKPRA